MLPHSILKHEGNFRLGAMVEIIGQDGEKIGRGLVESSSKDIEQYKSQNITKRKQPIIHYDNLVMF